MFCSIYHSTLFEQMQQIWLCSYLKQMIELSFCEWQVFQKQSQHKLPRRNFNFCFFPLVLNFQIKFLPSVSSKKKIPFFEGESFYLFAFSVLSELAFLTLSYDDDHFVQVGAFLGLLPPIKQC